MKWLTSAVLIVFLLGCAGGAAAKPAPDWTSSPPDADANYFYFTGAGTSKEKDQAQAERTARGVVIDEIMRYIGVRVTADTIAKVKASIDTFKSDVEQTISQAGSGRITGLQISDKYVEKRPEGTTVYLLARYNRADLAKEKKRMEEVFLAQIRAYEGPELEAKGLESGGDYYAAAIKYMAAAVAGAKSGMENARIIFERNVDSAKAAIGRISLVKLNDNLKTAAGTPFADPFSLKVVAGAGAEAQGIAGVDLMASYVEIRGDRKQVKTASLKTGDDGTASFVYPVPDFVGQEKLTVALDLRAHLETFDALPRELTRGVVGGLEDVAAQKKAVFSLTAYSTARETQTGIAVALVDESGNAAAAGQFSAGIMKALSDARYTVKALTMEPGRIAGRTDEEVIDAAASAAKGGTVRLIFGTAELGDKESEGEDIFMKATATVKVADLKTGQILLTVNRTESAVAKTESAARAAVLQQLGRRVGQEIANKLR